MKYTKLSIITFAAALLMTACGQKDKSTATTGQEAPKAAPVVSIITAQAEDVDINNTFTSNIEPYATNNIVSQTAGRIVSINAEVGQKVHKGQLLAKMDDAQKTYDYLVDCGVIVRNRTRVQLCHNCLRITIGSKAENNELIAALRQM